MWKICKILALCLISSTLSAEIIAIVDMSMITQKSKAMISLNQDLENKRAELSKEIRDKEQSLKKLDKELLDQKEILSKEAFEQKAKDFQNKILSEQNNIQEKTNALEKAYLESLEKVSDKINNIIKTKSESLKVDLVIPKLQVLFSSKKIRDISDDILSTLDKELPTIQMKNAV